MKRYLIIVTVLTLFCSGIYYGFNEIVFANQLHSFFPALVFFLFGQSLIVAWILSLAEKDEWKNPIYVLGAITFRFLTALLFLVVLYGMKPEDLKALMFQFVVLYLGYLIFELFAVLPNLRRN